MKTIPTRKTTVSIDEKSIIDFMQLSRGEIRISNVPDTFIILINNNKFAQEKYKERNPYGNGRIPKSYNFDDEILVRWQENKLQAM